MPTSPLPTTPAEPTSPQTPRAAPDPVGLLELWQVWDLWLETAAAPGATWVRATLGDAVRTGDWTTWDHLAKDRSHGLDPEITTRALVPLLVQAWSGTPDRLVDALHALQEVVGRGSWPSDPAGGATEQRLAVTLESIGDGVVTTHPDGTIERMNPVAQRLTGWTFADAVGHPLDEVLQVVDEDTGRPVPSRITEVVRRGVVMGLPHHALIVARDGSRRPIADSLAPIRDPDGATHGVVVVFHDLSPERAHEQALEASRARVASILEVSLDAILGLDAAGVVDEANPAAEQLFGRSQGGLAGATVPQLLREPAGPLALPGLVARLGHRRTVTAVGPSGGEVQVELVLVRVPSGGPPRYTCFLRDLTTALAAERALTDSHKQLRSLAARIERSREEERTRIARELHDELGHLLTALRMDLGWLAPRLTDARPEVTERLSVMTEVIDRTFATVRRLATELRPRILDDLGLADALEWQASEFAERTGLAVRIDVPLEAASLDRARSTAIFRIFQEALTNVARHAHAQSIRATLRFGTSGVTLEVKDDGRGIRPDEVADATSLGLLGMRERATLLGGQFTIGPAVGGGTRLTVTLPPGQEEAT